MKFTGLIAGLILFSSAFASSARADNQTRIPYLEARALSHSQSLQRADIQRQLVLLSAQTRLTPSWAPAYREIADVSLQVGRGDLADRALRKYHSLQTNSVMAQLELINLEIQGLANVEGRRQYLENKLKQPDLLPEVISDVYRQLAQISWQNYETQRAQKYLDLAIRRVPQNLSAWTLLKRIVQSDKTATPMRELEIRTGELESRLMTNPFDARSALEMAIICGKANEPERMKYWLDYTHSLKSVDETLASWPIDLQLEISESFLAIQQPHRAAVILKSILAPKLSTAPATTPATSPVDENKNSYTTLHARILLAVAARQLNDEKTATEQHNHLIRFANEVLAKKQGATPDILLTAIYLTLYADRPDYLKAISLAKIARETSPDDPITAIGLALPLAISGETNQSEKLLKEAREPNHPLVLLARAFIESNKKNPDEAKKLLAQEAETTPYGPLRDVFIRAAERLNLSKPPEPKLAAIHRMLKQFDTRYLEIAAGKKPIGELKLTSRGHLSRGQIVDLNIVFTNRTAVPLAIGPGSLLEPFVVLEFKTAGSRPATKPFIHYLPIEARQILEPGKSIEASVVLNQIAGWEEFIINRDHLIKEVTIQARLTATVPFEKPSTLMLAQSPIITLDLPQFNNQTAKALIAELAKPITNNPWDTAQRAKWFLLSFTFHNHHAAIIKGMLHQLAPQSSDSTRSAFIWALRSAKPEPSIISALAEDLKSKNWLIRFMTLDTLGQLQGKPANKLFEFYAANDCDELVRQLSAGYLLQRR